MEGEGARGGALHRRGYSRIHQGGRHALALGGLVVPASRRPTRGRQGDRGPGPWVWPAWCAGVGWGKACHRDRGWGDERWAKDGAEGPAAGWRRVGGPGYDSGRVGKRGVWCVVRGARCGRRVMARRCGWESAWGAERVVGCGEVESRRVGHGCGVDGVVLCAVTCGVGGRVAPKCSAEGCSKGAHAAALAGRIKSGRAGGIRGRRESGARHERERRRRAGRAPRGPRAPGAASRRAGHKRGERGGARGGCGGLYGVWQQAPAQGQDRASAARAQHAPRRRRRAAGAPRARNRQGGGQVGNDD